MTPGFLGPRQMEPPQWVDMGGDNNGQGVAQGMRTLGDAFMQRRFQDRFRKGALPPVDSAGKGFGQPAMGLRNPPQPMPMQTDHPPIGRPQYNPLQQQKSGLLDMLRGKMY